MDRFAARMVAFLAGIVPAGLASAADPITLPSSAAVELPVSAANPFDWNGFYAGVYGVSRAGSPNGSQIGIGVQAGINAQFDFYLLGGEVSVQGLTGEVGGTAHGQILGRAGLVVTDDVLIYAAGGYGLDLGAPGEGAVLLGGGVELAITDSVSLEAQYLTGIAPGGTDGDQQITFGANFHF